MRLWSNLEKEPLTPNLLFYIEDAEAPGVEAVENPSDRTETLKIVEVEHNGSMHGPVM